MVPEEMLMILPYRCSRMVGKTARAHTNIPFRSTARFRSQSSGVNSVQGFWMLAVSAPLFTRMSMRPKRSTVSRATRWASSQLVTSSCVNTASPPAPFTASTVAPPSTMSVTTTVAPSCAKWTQWDLPRYPAAPVTIATLPSNLPAIATSSSVSRPLPVARPPRPAPHAPGPPVLLPGTRVPRRPGPRRAAHANRCSLQAKRPDRGDDRLGIPPPRLRLHVDVQLDLVPIGVGDVHAVGDGVV